MQRPGDANDIVGREPPRRACGRRAGDERSVAHRGEVGAQHGQVVRLRGKGVPHLGSSGRGDQLVYLDVAVPRTLSKEQKTLYKRLLEIEGTPEQMDDARGVFDRIRDAIGGE